MSDKAKERISLRSVLDKIEKAADEQYDGRVYENILAIFKELEITEQRVFLRGLINIVLTFKNDLTSERTPAMPAALAGLPDSPSLPVSLPIPMSVFPPKATASPTPIVTPNFPTDLDDAGTLDEYNARELIRLKSWVVKKLVMGFFCVVAVIMGYVAFFGDKDTLKKTSEYILEMIKTAVGF
jgi:hypothetical protein